jgi:hypothetical protein
LVRFPLLHITALERHPETSRTLNFYYS